MCEQLESRALLAVFTVTSAAPAGPGSLRAAIVKANNHGGPDTINFQIPGGGAHTIILGNDPLPPITGRVTIDGYTQPGSARNTSTDPSVNNAVIAVNLDISGGPSDLLIVNPGGSRSQIRGLGFANSGTFGPSGIQLSNANFVTVDGCLFTARGQSRLDAAVRIVGGRNNTIGGDLAGTPALQNVMGTYDVGVDLRGTTNNAVVHNLIGEEPVSSRVPVQQVGVRLRQGANNNTIAGNILFKNVTPFTNQGVGNVIEDNTIVPR